MPDDRARRDLFERIVSEVYDPIQRYLRRRAPVHDAEDVLSEVLLTLWRRLEDVPAARPLPWSYGVARRALANHRRGNDRRLRLVKRLEAQPAPIFEPEAAVASPALVRALNALPPADREVVSLWAWEELEPREIAAALGTTPNAVSLRLSRARKRLVEEMSMTEPSRSRTHREWTPGEETS
jgi:RNA polymerase sigma-70 factor (ECF subfamily)